MDVPLIEDALIDLLSSPRTTGDTKRDEAVAMLQSMDYWVGVGSRPQGSGTAAITIERAGGVPVPAADSATGRAQHIIDFTFWSKDAESNRGNVRDYLVLLELVRIYLKGLLARDVKGVQITSIEIESEPFTSDEQPRDKSDGWTSRLTQCR